MIRTASIVTAIATLALSSGILYSGQGNEASVILDKAIKAHGGAANLAKFPALTIKMTGNYHGVGVPIPYTAEANIQGESQSSFALESKFNNMTFKFHRVLNGDKAWMKLQDEAAKEMPKDEWVEEKEKAYLGYVESLIPLRDKSFELALIGESKVDDKPVIGMRVSKKDHRDINLFFDKQSNLLVKTEMQVKDFMAGGMEYTQTSIFSDYKDYSGVKHATKAIIQKDGKLLVEAEMTHIQPLEKLDASHFNRP